MLGFVVLSSSRSFFLDLAELELLLVLDHLCEFLEPSFLADILTLGSGVVAVLADALKYSRSLHTLREPSDDVGAALVLILFYLNVCCHMWAKEYHYRTNNASYFLA